MFELSVLEASKTVGAFILYRDTLAFMIGPDSSGEKLGVVRLGGHIEDNESLPQCLKREIKEEGLVEVKLINSPQTLYKTSWEDISYYEVSDMIDWSVKPLFIVGDKLRSTAVFLSYTEEEPKPSSEACGIIFLKKDNIKEICSGKLKLRDFINNGGKLLEQKKIDYDMEMYAGVHLTFLYRLMEEKNNLVDRYIKGDLVK